MIANLDENLFIINKNNKQASKQTNKQTNKQQQTLPINKQLEFCFQSRYLLQTTASNNPM